MHSIAKYVYLSIVLILFKSSSVKSSLAAESCDVSKNHVTINSDADAEIAVIFALREQGQNGYGCGALTDSMEFIEATNWALDRINQNSGSINGEAITQSYIPGVKLGVSISDSCSQSELSTHSAILQRTSLYSKQDMCTKNNSKIFLGVIGDGTNMASKSLSSFLQSQGIPQISFTSTASDLSDKTKYTQFQRTVPSIPQHAQAMVSTLKMLQWEKLGIVYSTDSSSVDLYEHVLKEASNSNLCVQVSGSLSPSEQNQQVLTDALKKMHDGGATLVVYIGDSVLASRLFGTARTVPEARDLQWFTSFGVDKDLAQQYNYNNGLLTIEPSARHIAEFEDHWVRIVDTQPRPNNPWFQEAYMSVNQCQLPGNTNTDFFGLPNCVLMTEQEKRAAFQQNPHTESAIMAVYAFANALKKAHETLCPGSPGLCSALTDITPQQFHDIFLKDLEFTFTKEERVPTLSSSSIAPYNAPKMVSFDANGDVKQPMFSIFNYKYMNALGFDYIKVGDVMNGVVTLQPADVVMYSYDTGSNTRTTPLAARPNAPCNEGECQVCYKAPVEEEFQFVHVPGDLLLGALFPVHLPGQSHLKCGPIDPTIGAQFVEAFLFAINHVNDKKLLGELKLGGIVFDTCSSESLKITHLTRFNTNALSLMDEEGRQIQPSSVFTYLGALEPQTVNEFGVPALDVGDEATSNDLLKVLPFRPSAYQARAMAALLTNLGHNYVQIIYENIPDIMGNGLFHTQMQQIFMEADICIAGMYNAITAEDYKEAIGEANKKTQATALVFLGIASHVNLLLDSIQELNLQDRFTLFGTELWGKSEIIQDYGDITNYAYTLSIPQVETIAYQNYLDGLNPTMHKTNPWFNEWYEMAHNCYTGDGNKTMYSTKCPTNLPSITTSNSFTEARYNALVMNGVYTAAEALRMSLVEYCGGNYTTICAEFRTAMNLGEELVDNMDDIDYFNPEGDMIEDSAWTELVASLDVNFVMNGMYTKVGHYNLASEDSPQVLSVDHNIVQPKFTEPSTCSEGLCLECQRIDVPGQTEVMEGDLIIGGLFDIHEMGPSPFHCGGVNMFYGYQHYAAFQYALERVNNGSGPVSLHGIKLGSVAFDACQSASRSIAVMSGLHSSVIEVDGVELGNVVGWVHHSLFIPGLGDTAAELNVPLLGPNNDFLAEGHDYETYFSSTTSGEAYNEAIIKVLETFGWKYVHLIVDTAESANERMNRNVDSLREHVTEGLLKSLKESGTCVLETFDMVDVTADEVIQDILRSPTHVAIVSLAFLPHLLEAKQNAGAAADDIVFISANLVEQLSTLTSVYGTKAKGVISVQPDMMAVSEFDAFSGDMKLSDEDADMWFMEYYQFLYQCDYGINHKYGTPCDPALNLRSGEDYSQDNFVIRTMNSVFAMSVAIDKVLQNVCGTNYTDICDQFELSDSKLPMILDALKDVSFTAMDGKVFMFDDEQQNDVGYNVYISDVDGNFGKLGNYRYGVMTVSDSDLASPYLGVPSDCANQCATCIGSPETSDETFTFTPGDLILGGVFDIHEAGSTAFTCSNMLNARQGYQLLEAFNYAVKYVNDKRGIFQDKLNGTTLGSFALDSCKSATRIGNIIANIHSKTTSLVSAKNNEKVNPDEIMAYIGSADSDSSTRMADILTNLGIPQISYGATSVSFSNRQRYPFFVRTVPADDKQADAMVAFLRRNNIDYVQIVHSEGVYGTDGVAVFTTTAIAQGICISQTNTFITSEGDLNINANNLILRLLNSPDATVVVVVLDADDILPFLQAVQRNIQVKDSFRFLASSTYDDNPEYIDVANQAEQAAKNTISLGVETSDLTDFDQYLNDISQTAQAENPWFRKFYENIYECSLPVIAGGVVTASNPDLPVCRNPERGVTNTPNYKQDQYVLYVVNAVFAAALGVHSALENICGSGYNGLCTDFRYAMSQRQQIMNAISSTSFDDVTGQRFLFTEEGGSTRGYHLYAVLGTGASGYFDDIGSYNDDEGLVQSGAVQLNGNWDSNCEAAGSCTECPVLISKRSPYMDKTTDATLNIVAFFDVHSAHDENYLKCGDLNTQGGFQHMLAFYYALEYLPNNAKVGGIVIDKCGSMVRMSRGLLSFQSGEGYCGVEHEVDSNTIISYLTMGNTDTYHISEMLSNEGPLLISPTSTREHFKNLPDNYLSTLPSDLDKSIVIAKLVQKMQWVYVTVLHLAGEDGVANKQIFIENSRSSSTNESVCVAATLSIPSQLTVDQAKEILLQIDAKPGLNAVVLLLDIEQEAIILQAADELEMAGRFVFITKNIDRDLQQEYIDIAQGSLTLEPHQFVIDDFYRWVTTLNLENHGQIPDDWFEEFWQHLHQCRLETATIELTQYIAKCSSNKVITESMFDKSNEVYQTILTTQIMAQGVFDMEQCRNTSDGLVTCFKNLEDSHEILRAAVSDATWISPAREEFRFDDHGHGGGGYDVFNQHTDEVVKVGHWDRNHGLNLNRVEIKTYNSLGEVQTSFTSTCPAGQTCSCVDNTGINNSSTGGYLPGGVITPAALQQYDTEDYFGTDIGITLVVFTALGIIVTILLFIYLLIVYPVKGGTSVLGYLLLFAVLLLYVLNFAFIVYPTYEVCAVRRFCLGLIYALIFACMLVKVLNTWRIGDAWDEFNPPTYERLSHPCSLFSIVIALMLVQVIIGAQWLILRHPDIEFVEYEGKLLSRCSPVDFHNEELVMSCIYVMFLIILTMIFAGVTWDSEESNKESRWILVVCIFTIIIWIVWTIVSTLTEIKFRDPSIIIANLVNATMILLCIYIRKIYLLSKIQKEIDDDKKSQFSSLSREKEISNQGNGYYVNPAYGSLEVGSLRSHKSSHLSHGSHPSSHGSHRSNPITYTYDRDAAGADVAY